ncbi:MAG TPA: biosynthetic-type acetolactate synthase large subunit [Arenicellales bacterium]|jgi:acetolactate synthase-1/2/3 large subunit|nr:biosynthetic-type acetolactate synthase large subunit [Gammaproteobacteria bacterium]HJP07893.1 biosynthetic-type acetolactate synthase large subunit [Arenicellales bacterium]|tara:strand:- start:1240 stop:2976 length:1737 start_codon:yes stop_codon:yes gene_type:complete
MELTGAQIVVQSLKDEGVDIVFGYPGGAALHIYDALYNQEGVRHILVRHEQGATHAADGYARATGKTGVVLVTSGPGVTNTITGIATAYMDSIPMVILTAQVPTSLIGDDAFQEVDTVGITRPCVKHNFLVRDVKDLAMTIKKAFFIASSGRPGPVVVDIPKDVTAETTRYQYPKDVRIRSYAPGRKGHSKQISRAAKLLLSGKRPIIYTGGGIILSGATGVLAAVVEALGYPCTNTLMGLGGLPADHPRFLGMLGMHGTYEANMAMHGCDVMLAVGARFDDRVTGDLKKFSPNAQVIHVDIDPASIGKNVRVEVPIVGDAKVVLEQLLDAITKSKAPRDEESLSRWWAQIDEWRSRDSLGYVNSDEVIKPQFVIQKLHEVTQGEAFVTSDVGQHQMWAAQYYGFGGPRRWINSGGLGTMGFGLPSAIGVQLAYPEATVACVTGEASVMMCIQELSTCKQYDLPIKIVNLNNRYMGMVRQWQEFFYDRRYSHSYMDSLPDFVELATSFGHVGVRVEKPADVEGALREAVAAKENLFFLDFLTDQTENVYPMIAAGAGHNEMELKPSADGSAPAERELA